MPIIKSAKKKLRADKKRQSSNRKLVNILDSAIKKAKKLPSEKSVTDAISLADKAAKKKIIHKNKAARIKSKLSKLLTKKTRQDIHTNKTITPKRKSSKK